MKNDIIFRNVQDMGFHILTGDDKKVGVMTQYEVIYDFDNLYQAHKKARLGKQNTREVIEYEMHLTENLERLQYHLKNKTYRIQGYRTFTIYDPKKRVIHALAYGDRIVLHSLCDNVLGPYLDKRLIYDNAACRIGKGTHFAIDRLTTFLREFYKKHKADGYILKCDIRKYFSSIHHEVSEKLIENMKLEEDVKWLLNIIVDSYEEEEKRGLPMGNQTSQWFAILYLDGLERLVKEKLRVKYYSRYMDDMILIHEDKNYLKYCLQCMEKYVKEERKLEFNEKTQIHHIREGVDYLGFHFYMTDTGKVIRKLRQSNKKRIKKKLRNFKKLYREDKIDTKSIRRSLVSYQGHLKHGHTYHFRKNMFTQFVLTKARKEETT